MYLEYHEYTNKVFKFIYSSKYLYPNVQHLDCGLMIINILSHDYSVYGGRNRDCSSDIRDNFSVLIHILAALFKCHKEEMKK